MVASTTLTSLKVEQCRQNARNKSEKKRQAAFEALAILQQERKPITRTLVARRAGVSVVFLRSHPDLLQVIIEAEKCQPSALSHPTPQENAKDQVILALRRRLGEMKEQLASKDAKIRQKEHEIDKLYGKLAAGSPLADAELRQKLQETLQRLALLDKQEEPPTEMKDSLPF